MSNEGRTIQDIIEASITAQEQGCHINWQNTLMQYHQLAMAEITRLAERVKELEAPPSEVVTHCED